MSSHPPRTRHLVATLGLVAAIGCAASEEPTQRTPAAEAAEAPESAEVGPEARQTRTQDDRSMTEIVVPDIGSGDDEIDLGYAGHWDRWKKLADRWLRAPEARSRPFAVQPIYLGKHLACALLVVRDHLPRPDEDRAEVIIGVEGGDALLEVDGRPVAFGPGMVAALPPGARGRMKTRGRAPFLGLLVRSMTDSPRPEGAEARVLPLEDLFPAGPLPPSQPLDRDPKLARVATFPGGVSLFTAAIPQGAFHPPHAHPGHDELFFLLDGRGSFGLTTAGHLVRRGSLLCAPAGGVHHFEMQEPRGSLALMIYGPDLDLEDPQATVRGE